MTLPSPRGQADIHRLWGSTAQWLDAAARMQTPTGNEGEAFKRLLASTRVPDNPSSYPGLHRNLFTLGTGFFATADSLAESLVEVGRRARADLEIAATHVQDLASVPERLAAWQAFHGAQALVRFYPAGGDAAGLHAALDDLRRQAILHLDSWGTTGANPRSLLPCPGIDDIVGQEWRRLLASYARSFDRAIDSWSFDLTRTVTAAERRLRTTATVAERIEQASSGLRGLRAEWRALHTPGASGLTPALRVSASGIAKVLTAHDRVGRAAADLGSGLAEVRVPIVSTMKAGKSTLLGALLGVDLVPRRTHPMTVVATRYVAFARGSEPELRLDDATLAGIEDMAARVRRLVDQDESVLRAVPPHLVRLAAGLGRETAKLDALTRGTKEVLARLAFVHDFARLAIHTLPAEVADTVVGWLPEVAVPEPAWAASGPAALRDADGRLTVVFIDTPGSNEAALSRVLAAVIERQLVRAHGVVALFDYTQLDSVDTVAMAARVAAAVGAGSNAPVWAVANRIDQRRERGSRDVDDVDKTMRHLLSAAGKRAEVCETAAHWALEAMRFQADPTAEHAAQLRLHADPLGLDDAFDPELVGRLARTALRRSGLTELRASVFAGMRAAAGALLIDDVLTDITALVEGRHRDAALADHVRILRWAGDQAVFAPGEAS